MRIRRMAVVTAVAMAVLIAVSILARASTAWADEGVEVGVSTFVDSWQIIGNALNLAVGPDSCTLTVNGNGFGTGSVSCTKRYALLSLQVCIQVRQASVSEETSWQSIGSCQPKQALNSAYAEGEASAICVPGPAYYRTVVTAEGYNPQDSDPAFGGLIKREKVLLNCSIG